ncbi:ABC transporter permease [Mycoplana rhizolycopersici]|uniref:ABC transporter permease n=1 Tax=Mycoplana rhizolycopersici TaxID=2746702 RepID=A0ABX2QHV3_9HYPH|nr:ABC transporter permease [Rhizobium rhizolycopersici]NVP56921.1 ABC transporter permease [Rhizobium rhizolycopersici]
MKRHLPLAHPATALVMATCAWLVLVPLLGVPPRYLPSLGRVVADAISVWPELLNSFLRTLSEAVLGFLAGAALGIAFGVAFARSRVLERSVLPLFIALQSVPVIAFGAVVVIWFGNSLLSKVMIALYLSFFPVAVSTLRGLQAIDEKRVALFLSFGANRMQVFWRLALPTALPSIFTGLKLAVSLSLIGAIVGEWFGDTVGLGVMLLQALYFEQVERIWVLIVVCGLLGTLLYGLLAFIERKYVWWRPA